MATKAKKTKFVMAVTVETNGPAPFNAVRELIKSWLVDVMVAGGSRIKRVTVRPLDTDR